MPEQKQNQRPTPEFQDKSGEEGAAGRGFKIPSLHTFKGDVSEYLKKEDLSLVDIAKEASKQRRFQETSQFKKTFLLAGGIILLIVGLGIGGWWVFFKEKPPLETALQPPKSLIFSEKQEIIALKSERRSELIELIKKAMAAPIRLNAIMDAPILLETPKKKEFLNAQKFLEILEIKPPANFIQSLEGSFTLAVFYFKKNSPILIFKIRSFDLAFSGALNWEKNMAKGLKEIMLIENPPISSQRFQDRIIENRDVRILYDESNNPLLFVAFINKQHLTITTDLDTIKEIFRRFSLLPATR